jgi:hypothetical protein
MNAKDKKFYLIVGLSVIVIVLLILWFFAKKTDTFQIQDKCGKFINLFSHTIATEGSCKIRCEQQCETRDMAYLYSSFKEIENSCNECSCTCTDAW